MGTTQSCVICATPRTGSSLLCEGLTRTGVAGKPAEYFHNFDESRQHWESGKDFIKDITRRGSTRNGVFGIKVLMTTILGGLPHKLADCIPDCRADLRLDEILSELFPNVHYVWITRRDKIRQAISWFLMGATGIAVWEQDDPPEFDTVPEYDFDRLLANVRSIVYQESKWNDFFLASDQTPLSIVYEDLSADIDGTVRQVLHRLGIPAPDPLFHASGKLRRQSSSITEEWYSRFHADLKETFRRK